MSTSVPKIAVNSVVGAKIETTTGVAIAITGAECALFTPATRRSPPDESYIRRMRGGGQGNTKGSPGLAKGTFTCKIECVNGAEAGSSPLYATTFFPACNLVEDGGVWTPASTADTLTIITYEDGKVKRLTGARGTMKLSGEHGQIPVWDVTFQGVYSEPSDVVLPTVEFPEVLPDVDNRTITIGSYSPVLSKFEFDQANDVQMRENLNTPGGYLAAAIMNRDPSVTMDPEDVAKATADFDALFRNATEQALSIAIGSGTGNVVTLAADAAQVKARPGDQRNGILIRNLALSLNEAGGASPVPAYSISFT